MRGILSKALVFSFFLFSIFYFLSFSAPAYAIGTITPSQSKTAIPTLNTNSDVPNNLHNWTQNVMIEVMSSLTCQLAGVDPINPKQPCLGADQKTGKIGFLPSPQTGGAIGFMGNLIATLYTPPLHTADYFQNLALNFGISKHVLAANTGGTGFQSLTPLINIWSAFRNIVYLILVIIFVVIGLAIMLRVKIDPRTVMTIQNQIPKIIVGILAVTFSFAIAGFLIDMMWVMIYLIYGIFITIPGVQHLENFNPSIIQTQNVFEVANHISTAGIPGFTTNVSINGSGILKEMLGIASAPKLNPFSGDATSPTNFFGWIASFGNIFGFGINLNPISWLINVISGGLSLIFGFKVLQLPVPNIQALGFGGTLGWLVNVPIAFPAMIGVYAGANLLLREALPFLIIYLIVFIALLTALFRLWFTLLKAYVMILLDVVLAPFWIIGGIIPGSPISLGGWLKDIGANLLAFPVVIAMFMLGRVFVDVFGTTQTKGQFVPPLIGNAISTDAIGSLIGVGIILITPNVVNMLKQMFKAPKTDIGLGKAIGAGTGITGIPGKLGQVGLMIGGLQNIPGIKKLPFIAQRGERGTGTPKAAPTPMLGQG